MKYAKGVNKWPVFFKNQFYDTYEEAKKAQGSELFHYVIVTFFKTLAKLFVMNITEICDLAIMVRSRIMVFMMINGISNKTKNNVVKSV